MAKFAVIGHKGRMGQALATAIEEAGHEFCVGIDLGGDPAPVIGQCDVVVDFSSPDALVGNVKAARSKGVPILIGTTGLEEAHFSAIDEAARDIPILQTGNTSLGITLLSALVKQAAERLGDDWDIEVLEMHHRMKVDAPSGTAKLLGEAAAEGRGVALDDKMDSGRHGQTGARTPGDIGFATLRGGTVAGDHSVIFAGNEERLTLAHSAENRMIFARGAVRAGGWLIGKPPARYTMHDVLDL
ncbi:4-hydroxy-tetrahydrodipicolinate reductase [Erythrobacter sp. SCSIO 43205]|uniref:4-hydroxy-tetrahydrodipicolinate reductase n=1 Tax=Erythrobacter sp. SCSIO 43205 TaxID=2779361 RepID=UPI001CA870AA|nr:4-hydroxy-tetrahydrodipicolinate reductase [Erythrobacter sp. SCSIO 43205]UAB78187.1 4-hydroxy-tetrahydrodipicolinate reductase [Erythrobacter sp. SCSIO 43205]